MQTVQPDAGQILDVFRPVDRERSHQGETKCIPTTSTSSGSLLNTHATVEDRRKQASVSVQTENSEDFHSKVCISPENSDDLHGIICISPENSEDLHGKLLYQSRQKTVQTFTANFCVSPDRKSEDLHGKLLYQSRQKPVLKKTQSRPLRQASF